MRKLVLFMILLFTCISINMLAQNKSDQPYPWSLSFAYSPKMNISKNHTLPFFFAGESFFTSFDYKVDHRFSKHFSFSTGVDINRIKSEFNYLSNDGINSQETHYSMRTILIEIPIQINYHFRDTSKVFDPYIKIAFRMGFLDQQSEDYSNGFNNYEGIKYCNFMDMGLGSYLKLSQRLSFKYEISLGYGFNYPLKQYYYFEGLIGLRYTLKSK